jgi:PAS domain S-box-containing protein
MKVLVVDDQYINRYMLEKLLTGNGFEVLLAENGYEALEAVKSDSIELIISDILLPRMDGFQFCREVKSDPKLAKIPFIFYTAAYTEKKDQDFAMSLGADRYIIKPADPGEFISIIRELIGDLPHYSNETIQPVQLENEEYLSEHNRRLFHQLEKKLIELETLNKELRRSQERYKNLFENANDAIILHDFSIDNEPGRIYEVNEKACTKLQYTREELLTKKVSDLDAPFMKPKYPDIIARLYDAGHLTFEGELICRDGTHIPMEISSHLYSENGKRLCLSICRDITQRKQAMDELTRSLTQINNNIYQMATIGDKIRNPLSIILSACEECQGKNEGIVLSAVENIDSFISELDTGWVESDKIRAYLYHNYGIGAGNYPKGSENQK